MSLNSGCAGSSEGTWTRLLTSKATPQLICRSRYHVQSGIKRPLPAWLLLRLRGWLRAGVGRGAGLGTLLAGCLGVCVPRPVPVGAVARGPPVDGHTLARWDHPVSSKTVGPYSQQRMTKRGRGAEYFSDLCLLVTCELSVVPNVKKGTILRIVRVKGHADLDLPF